MRPTSTITLLFALLFAHPIICAVIHGPPVCRSLPASLPNIAPDNTPPNNPLSQDRDGTIQAVRNFSTTTLHQRITVTTRSTMTQYQHSTPRPECVNACGKWHVGKPECIDDCYLQPRPPAEWGYTMQEPVSGSDDSVARVGELSEAVEEEVSMSAVSEVAPEGSQVADEQQYSAGNNESVHEIALKPGLYAKISCFFADLAYGTYGTEATRGKRDKEL
ncbi:hypothetical protein LTR86_008308 [Recurvomyces mirabilis]|nr:hypothetical protein LTR86_008308 [Recurvomyces mirabilis]